MKKKYTSVYLVISFFVMTGCSAKLAKERTMFTTQGHQYSFQLPSSWTTQAEDLESYGQAAVFSGQDTKSNSTMFVTVVEKEKTDLVDFGEKTRKKLSETYQYEHVEDLYMSEFKINERPAYKFTAFTRFQEKDVWAHIYYIETQTSLVQMVYYSADDSNYKKRAQIIDQSARSIVEVITASSYEPES